MQPVQHRGSGAQRQAQQRLDRGDVRDHQHGRLAVVGDEAVPQPLHPAGHLVEALPAGGLQAGVAQLPAVHLGVALRGLAEGQSLPLAEVGFDEIVVDLKGKAQRVGGGRCGVVGAAQR